MLMAKSTTYDFSLEEVKKTIAKEMNVSPDKMTIQAIAEERGDDRFGTSHSEVTGILVTVKNE